MSSSMVSALTLALRIFSRCSCKFCRMASPTSSVRDAMDTAASSRSDASSPRFTPRIKSRRWLLDTDSSLTLEPYFSSSADSSRSYGRGQVGGCASDGCERGSASRRRVGRARGGSETTRRRETRRGMLAFDCTRATPRRGAGQERWRRTGLLSASPPRFPLPFFPMSGWGPRVRRPAQRGSERGEPVVVLQSRVDIC